MNYLKLGTEKSKNMKINFDKIYDRYKNIAIDMGYDGEIIFLKEKSNVLIYIECNQLSPYKQIKNIRSFNS